MRVALLLLPLCAAGCVGTAVSVVKAPFQVAGKAVDLATTSQAEADRNYGRRMRQNEAREGKERREWADKCHGHPDRDGCDAYHGYVAADHR
ncbi:hypothetical protein [Sphingomonas bacterium]|uniref:hypothetical protein n=1 Tax=Sphingomonas bacterium TaxID=1895847 RepID=UPI00157599CA|nr:hypothetical protein [Sphingomonas bacterium]